MRVQFRLSEVVDQTGANGRRKGIGIVTTVSLSNGTMFQDPEARIREYCEVEVYRDKGFVGGYDDHKCVDNTVSHDDIDAVNNLYALLTNLDRERIVRNQRIPQLLGAVKDADLGSLPDAEWEDIKDSIRPLISELLSIPNVKLSTAMKILHLKRPHLFPILDSYVIRFLTGADASTRLTDEEWLEVGMTVLAIARTDIAKNHDAFEELQSRLSDLPTPLSTVRLYDILCWTQEKWVIRGNTSAKYGTASKSLVQTGQSPVAVQASSPLGSLPEVANVEPAGEITSTKDFRRIVAGAEGVIVITGGSHPIAHSPLCNLVSDDRFSQDYVLGGKRGKYYWRSSVVEAKKEFGATPCRRCLPGGLTKTAPKW